MFIIYKHTSPSGKSYIGYTKNSIEQRFKEHCSAASAGSDNIFHKALRKYGKENFNSEILCHDILTLEDAKTLEKEFISKLNTFGRESNGYNMTPGGDGVQLFGELNGMYGKNHTEESKQKMKDTIEEKGGRRGELNPWHKSNRTEEELKERANTVAQIRKINGTYASELNGMYGKNHTEESKQKMKDTIEEKGGRRGENNSFYNKNHTTETKQKIREAQTGRAKTPEEIEKARISNTGKKRTKETCKNISDALKGKKQLVVVCPHCDKSGGKSNMSRYHFDNCKEFKQV